jgi:hypothetical protein
MLEMTTYRQSSHLHVLSITAGLKFKYKEHAVNTHLRGVPIYGKLFMLSSHTHT